MSKIQKSILVSMLCVSLVGLTGCSDLGTVTASTASPAAATAKVSPSVTEVPTESPEETATAAVPKETQSSPSATMYEKGKVTESTFESKFMDLKFILPDKCSMATEEALKALMEKTCKITYKDDSDKVIDYINMTSVYEMMAYGENGNPNVLVMAEKLPTTDITEEQYLESVKTQLKKQNFNYDVEEAFKTETLFGHEYLGETVILEQDGSKMVQKYYCRKIGDHMASLVLTYKEGDEKNADALMKGFSKYSE